MEWPPMSRKKKKHKALIICKYNSAVRCAEGSSCEKCSWNPKAANERTKVKEATSCGS